MERAFEERGALPHGGRGRNGIKRGRALRGGGNNLMPWGGGGEKHPLKKPAGKPHPMMGKKGGRKNHSSYKRKKIRLLPSFLKRKGKERVGKGKEPVIRNRLRPVEEKNRGGGGFRQLGTSREKNIPSGKGGVLAATN